MDSTESVLERFSRNGVEFTFLAVLPNKKSYIM
jgi:hypothetical protein